MRDHESPIVDLFRDPALSWVLDRIVQRLERGEPLSGKISKADATSEERRSVDNLLGRKSSQGRTLSLDLDRLARQYDLGEIVEKIRGPVINLRAEWAAESESWRSLEHSWNRRTKGYPWTSAWLEGLFSTGVLKRVSGRDPSVADLLLNQAWSILEVPFHEDVLLASLAASVSGDSHALDRGRALANLCLRGIAAREGIDGTQSAESRREAWAAIGVTIDDLSAPVLCLNLRAEPGTEMAPWIDWHVTRGEPFYLTWRQVRRFVPWDGTEKVFVCENPSVVSEATHRLGPRSRPLLCLNGLPSASVKALVRSLVNRAVDVSIRADFDWAGLRFIDQMRRGCGVMKLWRMKAQDYADCSPSQRLKGEPFAPNWAGDLPQMMREEGMAVFEEEMIDLLIKDLG